MNQKDNSIIALLGQRNWKSLLAYMIIFLILLTPVTYIIFSSYRLHIHHFEQMASAQRGTLVNQGVLLLEERFTKLTSLAETLATEKTVRQAVADKDWESAIQYMENVPRIYPSVERVFIADRNGVLWVDTPKASGNVRGQSFAYRDWYAGVSENWTTYVSEAFQRAALPAYNVINVASPIWSDEKKESVAGILVLQIKLETLESWARNLNVRSGGFLFFVDRYGHAIGHPDYQSSVPDLSSNPAVMKTLLGMTGSEEVSDPEGVLFITSYAPVPEPKWGVILQENAEQVHAALRLTLLGQLSTAIAAFILSILIILLVIFFIRYAYTKEQDQKVMLRSIGDAVVAIDRHFIIRLWNPAAEKISGFTAEEAIGNPLRKVLKFLREDDKKENITFLEDAMLFGERREMTNHTVLKTKNGQLVPVADSASPIFDRKGVVNGAIIVFRDVTEEREIENAKDEFISTASHQLRTPLTAIKWILESMSEEKNMPQKQRVYLKDLDVEVKRLMELVSSMLSSSRIDLEKMTPRPEPVDFIALAKSVTREMKEDLKAKGIILRTDFDNSLPHILADPKLVTTIFQNLLSNALKFSHENSEIHLSVKKLRSKVEIRVTDTGIGIPIAEQEQVFSKMFRAKNARGSEGTGLGLYVIKSIVTSMKGTIRFESKKNKGATFIIELPLLKMEPQENGI